LTVPDPAPTPALKQTASRREWHDDILDRIAAAASNAIKDGLLRERDVVLIGELLTRNGKRFGRKPFLRWLFSEGKTAIVSQDGAVRLGHTTWESRSNPKYKRQTATHHIQRALCDGAWEDLARTVLVESARDAARLASRKRDRDTAGLTARLDAEALAAMRASVAAAAEREAAVAVAVRKLTAVGKFAGYVPSHPRFRAMDEREARTGVARRFSTADLNLLTDPSNKGCVRPETPWKFCAFLAEPVLTRQRSKRFARGKQRTAPATGSVAAVLYNNLVAPLSTHDRLMNECGDVRCCNVHQHWQRCSAAGVNGSVSLLKTNIQARPRTNS